MKRISILLSLLLFVLSLNGCSPEDGSSSDSNYLVGKWEGIEYYDYTSDETFADEPGAVIWVFTKDRLTVHDEEDLFNGSTIEYEYYSESNEVVIWDIISELEILNQNEMIIHHGGDGNETGQKFKRID